MATSQFGPQKHHHLAVFVTWFGHTEQILMNHLFISQHPKLDILISGALGRREVGRELLRVESSKDGSVIVIS